MHREGPRRRLALWALTVAGPTAALLLPSQGCSAWQASPSGQSPDGGSEDSALHRPDGASNSDAPGSSGDGGVAAEGGDAAGHDSATLPPRGPTAATSTANFPFPQNRQSSGCIYPAAYLNSDVQTAYAKWTADLVTTSGAGSYQRVQRTSTDGIDTCRPLNSTVSEGIGYGMLIAVYMNDQSLFDSLWLYEQQNLDPSGLMNWAPQGPASGGCSGGATDADEDMAFALVMADKQWGGQGTLSQTYLATAIAQIQKIWANEIYDYKWVRAGDGTWATNANQNLSYYAPSYYRVFAQVDPQACAMGVTSGPSNPCDGWYDAIDQSYATIGDALNAANGNQSNGLVPGWCDDSNGAPCGAAGGEPFTYQYDACRTPFRVGLDWCLNGNSSAQSYIALTSAFFSGIGAPHIVDGYALNGTPQAANPGMLAAAFIGPASVGAMGGAMSSSTYQSFVNAGYAVVATDTAFAGGEYYESSWTVLSLLMLTGNFLDYTQETPFQ